MHWATGPAVPAQRGRAAARGGAAPRQRRSAAASFAGRAPAGAGPPHVPAECLPFLGRLLPIRRLIVHLCLQGALKP